MPFVVSPTISYPVGTRPDSMAVNAVYTPAGSGMAGAVVPAQGSLTFNSQPDTDIFGAGGGGGGDATFAHPVGG